MGLSITVDGYDSMIKDAKKAGADAQGLVRAALTNSTNRIQHNVREMAPHKTGTLQRSVLTQVNYPTAQVQVQEKYGAYIEFGTGPYDIYPKNKKALFWKGALNPYAHVHHPGIKAKPFFKPGVAKSEPYVQEQFVKVIEILTRVLAGK